MTTFTTKLAAVTTLAAISYSLNVHAEISPQRMADAIFAVIESDRAIYTKHVVNRLQNEEEVITADEHWEDEQALPLPAQMLRMGAEEVAEKDLGVTYALMSTWPINKQNEAVTEVEKAGMEYIMANPTKRFYSEETLGGVNYFTAVYQDIAVSEACVQCHNDHQDSPRDDFKVGDVMGGVVLRIKLD
ncbi:Tll0287-like domain-containing protein [Arenicella xantha]|uniref:Uncharacterized protein DUF3365 n=1 Tax=Arenicella xantha TaxID=644221 RepID=A0A395JP60_9GAMM|nr:DUF3365 domain-containing protein [Arenicella xantha]RBP51348.1 uncharacterized protein DUF3365 [Arenicella xantha]